MVRYSFESEADEEDEQSGRRQLTQARQAGGGFYGMRACFDFLDVDPRSRVLGHGQQYLRLITALLKA